MLDIKLLREHPDAVETALQTKEADLSIRPILALDTRVRELKTEAEELKAERNRISKQIGEMKRTGAETGPLFQEGSKIGERIELLDQELREHEEKLDDLLGKLPNLPMDDIKVSPDAADNVCIKSWGEKPTFSFPFKNHLELNEKLHLFDFQRGAKITGSGWPVYCGMGARLEWALIQYMMQIHIDNGYIPWVLPHCVRASTMFGAAQIPKFTEQMFRLGDDEYPFFLIPTGEVPLNGLHMEEILEEAELPKRYVSYTPCFRREAGAAGKQERGLIRVHQFNKVEMFCYTTPEQSKDLFEEMVTTAGKILEGLGIHYRNMLLVTGDMSFASARTVDVEVWLPGQDRYYEVSSISNCTDFQARRAQTRFKSSGKKSEFVHTLNGSGLATSRLMVSLLECNQQADGSVIIPPALRPYLGGIDRLEPKL
jgi:seryl-tRNA synthetase